MVPASNLRQWPLLLHISTAEARPCVTVSAPVPGAVSAPVIGSRRTFQADQSSAGTSGSAA
ncbi:hypothetical protein D9M68_521930 [compost metagenome]